MGVGDREWGCENADRGDRDLMMGLNEFGCMGYERVGEKRFVGSLRWVKISRCRQPILREAAGGKYMQSGAREKSLLTYDLFAILDEAFGAEGDGGAA